MKECRICLTIYPIEDYPKAGKNNRKNMCKKCFSEIMKVLISKTKEYIQSLKSECSNCGYSRCKEALEFHHVDEKTKSFNLARASTSMAWSDKTKLKIDNEIKKCIVLCANCHREVTFQ